MKILYIAPSPKAGQTEHLQPNIAQTLIAAGFAQEVPRAPRGTAKWFAEMQELEAERQKNIPADQRQHASTVPEWTLRSIVGPPQKFVVVKSSLAGEFIYGETLLMDRGRPDFKASAKNFAFVLKEAGCPQSVIQQWLDARNAPDYLAAERSRIEADKQAAELQRQREKNTPKFF